MDEEKRGKQRFGEKVVRLLLLRNLQAVLYLADLKLVQQNRRNYLVYEG